MWVGAYHYQSPPAKALNTQKLTSYPTRNSQPTCYPAQKLNKKLTSHMLPFPKKHTCETMLSPSEVVGWECGACAYTKGDGTRHNCLACQARRPVRYVIVAGAKAAATAKTTRVDYCNQACITVLPTAGPVLAKEAANSANEAVTGEGSNAAYGTPAVAGSATIHHGRAPQLGGDHARIVARLVKTMVDIVGTSAKDRGYNCPFHNCCGM
jgi:hypothetical protein